MLQFFWHIQSVLTGNSSGISWKRFEENFLHLHLSASAQRVFPDSQYFCKFFIAILNYRRKEHVGIFWSVSPSRTDLNEWIIRSGGISKTESQISSVKGVDTQVKKGICNKSLGGQSQRTEKSEWISLSVCWGMLWVWLIRLNQMEQQGRVMFFLCLIAHFCLFWGFCWCLKSFHLLSLGYDTVSLPLLLCPFLLK